jgi:hypothetical protein
MCTVEIDVLQVVTWAFLYHVDFDDVLSVSGNGLRP